MWLAFTYFTIEYLVCNCRGGDGDRGAAADGEKRAHQADLGAPHTLGSLAYLARG